MKGMGKFLVINGHECPKESGKNQKTGGGKRMDFLRNRGFLRHFGVLGTGFFAVADREFGIDIIYMGLNGAEFDELNGGNFLVSFAFSE